MAGDTPSLAEARRIALAAQGFGANRARRERNRHRVPNSFIRQGSALTDVRRQGSTGSVCLCSIAGRGST